MTWRELEKAAKYQIIQVLRKQGYPTYAKLFDLFDLKLTDDPDVVGYMIPSKAIIVINKDLNINQVSTIVRHEILHEYFSHGPRGEAFEKAHANLRPNHELSNIAADFDISNKGYTDADKIIVRNLMLGDRILSGLVTEDQYADWVDLSYEEMYERLLQQQQQDESQLQALLDQISKLTPQDIDDILDKIEELENESEQQQDSEDGSPNAQEVNKQAQQLGKQAQNVKNQLGKMDDNGTPIDTPEEQAAKDALARRVEEIKKQIKNLGNQLEQESTTAIDKEKAAKEAKKAEQQASSPLNKFRISLNHFIANQIDEGEVRSYAILHPSYEDSGFIVPGRYQRGDVPIPLVNVYWDVSGSFSNPSKTNGAKRAIGTIDKYVKRGLIAVKYYYFADKVASDPEAAGGGTNGDAVIDHINKTKPTNVIVITDSDVDNTFGYATVKGAVWVLFYDYEAPKFMKHLQGKKETKAYLITNY